MGDNHFIGLADSIVRNSDRTHRMACLSLFHGIWRPSLEDPSGWVGAGTVRRLLHTPGARPGVTWTPAPARPVAGGQEHVGSSHSLGSLPAWQPRRSVVGVPPWSPPAATRSCTGFRRPASEGRTLRPRPGAVRSPPSLYGRGRRCLSRRRGSQRSHGQFFRLAECCLPFYPRGWW